MSLFLQNGEYQGYDVYFARRIGEDLGVEVDFALQNEGYTVGIPTLGSQDTIAPAVVNE